LYCLLCMVWFLLIRFRLRWFFFFFQAEDGIRDADVTGVQTCALPISRPSSPPGPFERVVERSTELVEEFVYLILRNDQRWTDRNRLADVSRDQAVFLRASGAIRGHRSLRIERRLCRFVRDDFHRTDHTDAAR